VEQATLSLAREGASDGMLAVDLRRADIESALESAADGSVELLLDIATREADGETAERHTLTVDCTIADLERMLESSSDTVRVGFDADALARAIREPDIEAHGLREKIAVLAIVVATTGAAAGAAQAMPTQVQGGGTGTTVTEIRDMPADSMIALEAAQASGATAVHDMAADTLAASAAASQSGVPVHDMAADTLAASAAASSGPAAAPVRDFPGDVARSVAAEDAGSVARDFPGDVVAAQAALADSSKAPPVASQGSGGIDLPGIDAAQFVVVGGIALALVGAAFAAAGVNRRTPKRS
jgi:hypothetical protein